MNITEHLEKLPYLLSLFVPVLLFFLLGLWFARRAFREDHQRLQRAIEENDHLAAELIEALAPERDLQKDLLSRLEVQKIELQERSDRLESEWTARAQREEEIWSAKLREAEEELFTEKCRSRDLRNRLSHFES